MLRSEKGGWGGGFGSRETLPPVTTKGWTPYGRRVREPSWGGDGRERRGRRVRREKTGLGRALTR